MKSRFHRGFTLVELLVVIGIIGVLIAILLPVLSRSQIHARSVACQANLRQWGTAGLAYAQENNGYLPRRGQGVQPVTQIDRPADWFNALPAMFKQRSYADRYSTGQTPQPGDGSVWWCPEFVVSAPHPHQFAYAMNMKVSTWNSLTADKITRVGPASTLVFIADAPGPFASILPAAAPAAYNPVARHRGKLNIAFLDGHVATFAAGEIGIGVGEPQRADVAWTPKRSAWSGPNP